jgi:hypothetical protein
VEREWEEKWEDGLVGRGELMRSNLRRAIRQRCPGAVRHGVYGVRHGVYDVRHGVYDVRGPSGALAIEKSNRPNGSPS